MTFFFVLSYKILVLRGISFADFLVGALWGLNFSRSL